MNINNKIADEEAQHTNNENDKEHKSISSSRKKRKLKIKIGSKAKKFEAAQLQKVDKNMELIDDNFDTDDFENVVIFHRNHNHWKNAVIYWKLHNHSLIVHCILEWI